MRQTDYQGEESVKLLGIEEARNLQEFFSVSEGVVKKKWHKIHVAHCHSEG